MSTTRYTVSRQQGWVIGVAAGVLISALPAPASAQGRDVRVDVRVRVPAIAADTLVSVLPAQRRGSFRVEREDRETRTLALGASGTLSLHNLAGDIRVRTGPGAETTMLITRTVRGRTDADAQRGLDQARVGVDQRGDRATVSSARIRDEDRERFSVSVEYEITAPAGTAISVETLAGDIDVAGITGDLSLSSMAGDLTVRGARRINRARTTAGDVRLIDVQSDGTLEAGSIAGDIVVEQSQVRRLAAQTVSGDVRARDVVCDRAELTSTSGTVEFAGPLAAGGRYELLSHAGDVRFVAVGDRGFELRATTVVGQVRVGEGLNLTIVSRGRRELHGTFGDASAEVIATSFAGEVRIVRR
jgi:hypothetical protein